MEKGETLLMKKVGKSCYGFLRDMIAEGKGIASEK